MARLSAALAPVIALVLATLPTWALPAQEAASRSLNVIKVPTASGGEERLYDESHALVVAVSRYTRGWPSLPGVRVDAERVEAALKAAGFSVTVVSDPDAEGLRDAFEGFIQRYGQGVGNRLLFYFAGHGHTLRQSYGEEMGYIVPVDAPLPDRDPAGFLAKAMDMQMIEVYAKRIQSKYALFLFDSCFSGSLFAITRAVPESIGYKTSRPVRQFITSGSADEAVADDSIFCRQFVEALQGDGDLDGDGYVTGTELGMFLQDSVINYTRSSQHPQYGKIRNPNLDKGDFVFASARGPERERGKGGAAADGVPSAATSVIPASPSPAPAIAARDDSASATAKAEGERPVTLSVTSVPPSAVYLDGELRGDSPLELSGLETGEHRVELRLDGYKRFSATVTVTRFKKDYALSAELAADKPFVRSSSGLILVPLAAGIFDMGSSRGEADERPVHRVTFVRDLLIGRHEVTNAQFCEAMNRALAKGAASLGSGDLRGPGDQLYAALKGLGDRQTGLEAQDGRLSPRRGKADHPVVGVSWYGALAFCNAASERDGLEPVYTLPSGACDWTKRGYRLPTEAEWEYAACGTGLYRRPWGDDIDERFANYFGSKDPFESPNPPDDHKGGPTTPVGFYDGSGRDGFKTGDSAAPCGAYDLIGNVHEWCWDWYGSYGAREQKDPRGPATGSKRVYRGGSWMLSDTQLYSTKRFADFGPEECSPAIGFRVAVDATAPGFVGSSGGR